MAYFDSQIDRYLRERETKFSYFYRVFYVLTLFCFLQLDKTRCLCALFLLGRALCRHKVDELLLLGDELAFLVHDAVNDAIKGRLDDMLQSKVSKE